MHSQVLFPPRDAVLERSPDLVTRLRHCTRAHHEQLDAAVDFRRDGVTPKRYAAFLRGILAVTIPLERALASWFESGMHSRSECLRADLAELGVTGEISAAAVHTPADIAEAYGCAYVLEGSALGGIVLAPLVEKALGDRSATAYLRFRGDDTGRAWRAWLDELNAFGRSATDHQMRRACEMACATFDAYAMSLRASGALRKPRT